jgi:hypothetical protein
MMVCERMMTVDVFVLCPKCQDPRNLNLRLPAGQWHWEPTGEILSGLGSYGKEVQLPVVRGVFTECDVCKGRAYAEAHAAKAWRIQQLQAELARVMKEPF